MADNNFYYQLKEKLRALSPSDRHQADDWVTLRNQLDSILPVQSSARPIRWIGAVLFLATLLVLSNIFWWSASQKYTDKELTDVTNGSAQKTGNPEDINLTNKSDTIWQMVYMPIAPMEAGVISEFFDLTKNESADQPLRNSQTKHKKQNDHSPILRKKAQLDFVPPKARNFLTDFQSSPPSEISVTDNQARSKIQVPLHLSTSASKSVESSITLAEDISKLVNSALQERDRSSTSGLLDFLKPSGLKVGVGTAVLYPLSSDLEKKTGLEWGTQGVVSFSRNLALIVEYSQGQLNYIASKPRSVLGDLELPPLPSSDHMHSNIDIKKQPYQQFGLGLRYTFSPTSNLHPFVGLTWINKTVKPYSLEYDLHHVASNTTEHKSFHVTQSSSLRDLVRLGVGLDLPISPRFGLTMEGFYTKQWKLTNHDALHLTGLRISGNWRF